MTIAEIEHDIFEKMINNKDFKNNVINKQSLFKHGLLEILINEKDKTTLTFLRKMLEQVEENNIYILPMGQFVMYFTKDFKSTIAFALRKPNIKHAECFSTNNFIEVDALHSNKKGHGSFLMNTILNISDTTHIPIALWSETSKNTNYFKKFKFKPYGKRGDNNEELLIRKIVPFK